jgi:hypothetical protein
MSSQIDITKPAAVLAYTADVRANFAIAADEISALQTPRMGVTDGSDAGPGEIGEYLTTENIDGVAMGANVALAICTLSLPPGCWEVWGACDFTVAGTRSDERAAAIQPNQLGAAISVTPDSLPTDDELILGTGVMQLIYSPLAAGQRQVLITGQCRSNSIDPVDLYLVAQIGLGNCTVKGYVSARRVR